MPKKILCIEDDKFISEMYYDHLQKAGYEVEFAKSGMDAINSVRDKRYDLILLDLLLPEIGGDEVLKTLREEQAFASNNSKVIVLTNYLVDDTRKKELELLSNGYYIKTDVTPKLLLEICENALK